MQLKRRNGQVAEVFCQPVIDVTGPVNCSQCQGDPICLPMSLSLPFARPVRQYSAQAS